MIDFRVLRFFLKVSQAGSISRASEELRIAQPALSKIIRSLEQELGVLLFNRTGRGVSLTETGMKFSREVAAILERLDVAISDVRREDQRTSGEVRIGILPNLATDFASDLILEVNTHYPEIRLVLLEGYSATLARHLVKRELDFGFVHSPERFNGLDIDFCLHEDGFLVGSKFGWPFGLEVEVRDLPSVPIITSAKARPGGTSLTRIMLEKACLDAGISANIVVEMESWEVQKRMIAMRKGAAIFPMSFVSSEVAEGTLAVSRIVNPTIHFDLALVSSSWTSAPRCSSAVVRVIRDLARKYLTSGRWVGEISP